MFFKKSKTKNNTEQLNDKMEAELLDLEDEILSETGGGGDSPNVECGVQTESDSPLG